MFSIYDGRTQFYQWDRDRKLIVNDPTITKVHFCNRTGSCSLVRCVYEVNGMYLVDVPNIILQESYRINVYGYDNEYTKHSDSFNIVPRTKPEDYVYTDAEVAQWEALEERVAAIEENGVSQETINEAVEEYLNEHPVQSGATEEEKAQIAANTEDIAAIKEDYASQLYVAAAISDLELEQFALKTDIPSLKGYATEAYVDEAVAASGGSSEGNCFYVVNATLNMATDEITFDKTWEEIYDAYNNGEEVILRYNGRKYEVSKILGYTYTFLWMNQEAWEEITINSDNVITRKGGSFLSEAAIENKLSGYATETYVDNALKSYAKTTDIPDVSAYQTAAQVQTAIANYVGVIENGSY